MTTPFDRYGALMAIASGAVNYTASRVSTRTQAIALMRLVADADNTGRVTVSLNDLASRLDVTPLTAWLTMTALRDAGHVVASQVRKDLPTTYEIAIGERESTRLVNILHDGVAA